MKDLNFLTIGIPGYSDMKYIAENHPALVSEYKRAWALNWRNEVDVFCSVGCDLIYAMPNFYTPYKICPVLSKSALKAYENYKEVSLWEN